MQLSIQIVLLRKCGQYLALDTLRSMQCFSRTDVRWPFPSFQCLLLYDLFFILPTKFAYKQMKLTQTGTFHKHIDLRRKRI